MARSLVVNIVGDSTSLDRALKKSQKSVDTFGRNVNRSSRGAIAASGAFSSMGRSIAFASGSFLTGAGLIAVLKSSTTAAIDLEQQISKTNVVFAESGKEVTDWSKTLASAFGLSQREALTTASTFGALFAPVGLTGDNAAEVSKQLTELGADLASFYNTDVASALDALRSGLVGESEPLRKYGVRLSEVRVQQEALLASGKDNVKNLTELEKTHARIAIIMQDSTLAQGDFGRTSETAANQIKTLDANVENLKANLATYAVPVLSAVVAQTNNLFEATKRLTGPGGQSPAYRRGRAEVPGRAEAARATCRKFPEPFTERGEIERRESVAAAKAKKAAKAAAKMAEATRKPGTGRRRGRPPGGAGPRPVRRRQDPADEDAGRRPGRASPLQRAARAADEGRPQDAGAGARAARRPAADPGHPSPAGRGARRSRTRRRSGWAST